MNSREKRRRVSFGRATSGVSDASIDVRYEIGGHQCRRLWPAFARRSRPDGYDAFDFDDDGEYSIEIDPRSVDAAKIGQLARLGFNRMSLGVQDIDPAVQRAVNRVQSLAMTARVLDEARQAGFRSINVDLIYGLPLQSAESFARTIAAIVGLRPERVALYHYAHLPERFPAQRLIHDENLPTAVERAALFAAASRDLERAGYVYIGMDHFALPEDDLARAHRAGTLHRNFQGYSTRADRDLVALGPSAISRLASCYAQNARGFVDWCERIESGALATRRGITLGLDEKLRRTLIMTLMCDGQVRKRTLEQNFGIDFDEYFAPDLLALAPLLSAGLAFVNDEAIGVTGVGRRHALRAVGAAFDPPLRTRDDRRRFSRVL